MFKVKVKYSNHNNFATDCSIPLKFGTEFHCITGDTLQMLKVKGQGHSVGHGVISKNAIRQQLIG